MQNKSLNDLTVFIICFKKKQFIIKKRKLLKEYSNLIIKPIIAVFPMSEAFNEMHRKCNTKYFLQLDEDMSLKKNAIYMLLDEIKKTNIFTICVTGQLFERDFGPGGAVKIWKSAIFNFFEFGDNRTVDRKYFSKLFFLRKKNISYIIGYHEPRYNKFTKFSKVLGDVCKWKYLKSKRNFLYQMLQRILIEKNLCEIFALYISLNVTKTFIKKSKNYEKDYIFYKKFKKLEKYFSTKPLDNKKLNFEFFNLFINAYEKKDSIKIFNSFFIKNFIKKDKIKSSQLLQKIEYILAI